MKSLKFASCLLSAFLLTSTLPSGLKSHADFSVSLPDIVSSQVQVPLSELPVNENTVHSSSVETAVAEMRSYLSTHTTSFSVSIPRSSYSNANDAPKQMLAKAFAETSKGCEGDYIRYSLGSYECKYSISSSYIQLNYSFSYYTTPQEEEQITSKVNSILDSLDLNGKSEYEKIKSIYFYISSHVHYAQNTNNVHVFSAYGALFDNSAVCQGYSQLFYRMMKDAGISCRIISGQSNNQNHTWNIARIGSLYYLLDVTWDSCLGTNSRFYFLKGSKDFDNFKADYKHIPVYQYEVIFDDFNSDAFKTAYPLSDYAYSDSSLPSTNLLALGDVDGNGKIDALDASAVLTAYTVISTNRANPLNASQQAAADVDRNNQITAMDASYILSFYTAASAGKAKGSIIDYINSLK